MTNFWSSRDKITLQACILVKGFVMLQTFYTKDLSDKIKKQSFEYMVEVIILLVPWNILNVMVLFTSVSLNEFWIFSSKWFSCQNRGREQIARQPNDKVTLLRGNQRITKYLQPEGTQRSSSPTPCSLQDSKSDPYDWEHCPNTP